MKGLFVSIIVLFILMWGCATCVVVQNSGSDRATETTINIVASAAEGLDLQALGELVKRVDNAEQLEKELNKPGGINNLDLDADANVDFIKVTEYGNGKDEFGFSLTTEPVAGEVQEVATIEIFKDQAADQAQVQVTGNQQVYGSGHHYGFLTNAVTFGMLGYLLGSHNSYRSPWRYGNYPSYYRPYPYVSPSTYRDRMRNGYTRSSTVTRSPTPFRPNKTITSPNQGKVANQGIRRNMASPTATQRQFQARNPAKSVGRGGFGRSSSGSSVRNRSSSRSFGGRGK